MGRTGVARRAYTHCADGADVVLYTIQGGGHSWPGGGYLPECFVGRTTQSIDASSVMWAFFREHPFSGEKEGPAEGTNLPAPGIHANSK